MEVQLNLKRVQTSEEAVYYDVKRDVSEHSAEAALCLYFSDVLALESFNQLAKEKTLANLKTIVLDANPVMLSKLSGKTECTLRLAAFSIMLSFLPSTQTEEQISEALAWAAAHGLRSSVREIPSKLSDVLFSLETLVTHWEILMQQLWSESPPEWGSAGASLGGYLDYLWSLCARFVLMTRSSNPAALLDASAYVLPYASAENAVGHELGLHTKTVSLMAEIWRFVEQEKTMTFAIGTTPPDNENEPLFLRVFEFEKNQLKVDKFRENLRKRLVERFLFPADTQIVERDEGKDVDPDGVMGKRCPLHMPGYMQEIATSWTFEEMQAVPIVRDELYRAMADTAFRNKMGFLWSQRFFPTGNKDIPRIVPVVKRFAHGFIVVYKNKSVAAPSPFATAFRVWAKLVHRTKPYNVDMSDICKFF